MTEKPLHLDQEDLLYIANLLQYLVKKPRDLQSWQDVQEQGGYELTTAVLGIEKAITSEAFFDPYGSDAAIEKINLDIGKLIESVQNLGPELSDALKRYVEDLCITEEQVSNCDHLIETLQLFRDGTVRLLDRIDEKAPRPTRGANNWRTEYIAQYAATYYHSVMHEWPLSPDQNSNNRIRNVLGQIHEKYKRSEMGGHIRRADKIVTVLAFGKGKLPAPLI